jgi:hypothetical protein
MPSDEVAMIACVGHGREPSINPIKEWLRRRGKICAGQNKKFSAVSLIVRRLEKWNGAAGTIESGCP